MSSWEDIGSTYSEAVTQALPLHRAVIFLVGFYISIATKNKTHLSAIETLAMVPLNKIKDFDEGFLSNAFVENVFFGVFAILFGVLLSKLMLISVYKLVQKSTKLAFRSKNTDSTWLNNLSMDDRKAALEVVEMGLLKPRSRLRRISTVNEILCGTAVVLLGASIFCGLFDFVVGFIFLVFAVVNHFYIIKIFISDYYGQALVASQLQGKELPSINNLD